MHNLANFKQKKYLYCFVNIKIIIILKKVNFAYGNTITNLSKERAGSKTKSSNKKIEEYKKLNFKTTFHFRFLFLIEQTHSYVHTYICT